MRRRGGHVAEGRSRRRAEAAHDITRAVVIGDQVAFGRAPDGCVVRSVAQRGTVLSRPGFHGVTHLMAANIDHLVVLESVHNPSLSPLWVQRVQRTCVPTTRGGVAPLLVVNKIDLVGRTDRDGIAAEAERMDLRMLSALTGEKFDRLLRDRA